MKDGLPRWAIVNETLCGGVQPYYTPDEDKVDYSAFIYATRREAKIALLEAWRDEISSHMDSPNDYEDDDLPACEGWIVAVDLHEDMSVTSEEFEWTKEQIYASFGMEIPK